MKLAEVFHRSQVMQKSGAAQTVHYTRVCLMCNQVLAEQFSGLGPADARYVKNDILYLEVSSPSIAANYRVATYDILRTLLPLIEHIPVHIKNIKVNIQI